MYLCYLQSLFVVMSFQFSVRDYYLQSGCKQETHRSTCELLTHTFHYRSS